MGSTNYNILCITGPTAGGKTRLAVKLALKYGCEIISGDSRQVYRGMDIGTGKDLDEYKTPAGSVRHHLIDIVQPCEEYSLYRYLQDFSLALADIKSRGSIPLLAGGSGLYIEAALKGYSLPHAPENPELRLMLEAVPADQLESMLKKEAPDVYLRTDVSSRRRIIRGIEIARYMEEHPEVHTAEYTGLSPLIICISLPRDELTARIDRRLEERLSQGLTAEVQDLIGSGMPHEKLLKLGLEYRYAAMHIAGDITREEMTARLKTEIHRFAKRQMTWFRGMERRGFRIHWINGADVHAAEKIIDSNSYAP